MADEEPEFYGIDGRECDRFIAQVVRKAFQKSKLRDSEWLAGVAATGFRDDALHWWLDLDDDVQGDWKKLQRAMRERWPKNIDQSK